MIKTLSTVLNRNPGLAPGLMSEDFHLLEGGTDAVVCQKIRDTDGYMLLHSAEAGSILTMPWPEKGQWSIGTHPDIHRLFEAANGGKVQKQTMETVRLARAARDDPDAPQHGLIAHIGVVTI